MQSHAITCLLLLCFIIDGASCISSHSHGWGESQQHCVYDDIVKVLDIPGSSISGRKLWVAMITQFKIGRLLLQGQVVFPRSA